MDEVRKTVTAVFCDLVGSTELGEKLDPETLHEILSAYYEEMASVTRREGGRVEKYIGDAVVAVFGAPKARHDDAIRAVKAAVGMRDAMEKLGEREYRRLGVRVKARIGINTGEVISRRTVDGSEVIIGDAMNTAARIQTAAPANAILMSGSTFELSANWAIVRPAPAVEAKGKSRPITVLELLDVVKGVETSRIGNSNPILGRSEEMMRLLGWLEKSRSGRPVSVMITGPPGIGKSRLAKEFVQGANATFVRLRCQPPGDESRIGGTERLDPDRGLPELLLLEDAHWAEDLELFEILKVVESSAGPGPLSIFVGRPELASRINEMSSTEIEHLDLEPLSVDQIRELIKATAGGISPELIDRVAFASEGNPLHARELARAVSIDGSDALSNGIPKSIRALLSARIDELPANERSLIELASIAGQNFRERDLVALSDSIDDGNSSEVAPLTSRGILRVAANDPANGDRMLAFENSTIREIVYESMLRSRKAILHERFARLLGELETEARPEQIAGHLIGAAENLPPTPEGRKRQSELASEAAVMLSRAGSGTLLQSRVASSLSFRAAELLGYAGDETAVSSRNLTVPETALLMIGQADGTTRTIELDATQRKLTIGRLLTSDIALPRDLEVSRKHATIAFDGGWWIDDLGSRNGVKVNGKRIYGACRLEPGDQIELGLSQMKFNYQSL